MANDTLTLLQTAVRKRGGQISSITPVAEDLCRILDHWNSLHWEDRNRLTNETNKLKAQLARLDKASHQE
jgi:hypothetical protein